MSEQGPLDGVVVIDTSGFAAAPSASRILGDWGARVIKFEHPVRGDLARGVRQGGTGDSYWELLNRNKTSVTLDFQHPMAKEIIHRFVAGADVFLTHFRPYELRKFNLDYPDLAAINPRLVFASLTGYGRRGPDCDKPGFDMTAFWARSGAMHMHTGPGSVPPPSRPAYGDVLTGMSLALGVVTTLYHRQNTGEGQLVEASLLNTGLYALCWDVTTSITTGADIPQEDRTSNRNPLVTSYRTADDRWLILCFSVPDLYWEKLCVALGRPELAKDSRFATHQARTEAHDELRQILEDEFGSRTLEEWRKVLDAAGVPWSPAQTVEEVVNDPQVLANDMLLTDETAKHAGVRVVGPPVQLHATPARVRAEAPELGQSTEEILLEYGYDRDDILRFKEAGVIA